MLNKKVALLTASPALFSFLAKSLEPFVFLQQTLQAVHLLGNYQSFTLLLLFASLLWIGGKMNGYIIHKVSDFRTAAIRTHTFWYGTNFWVLQNLKVQRSIPEKELFLLSIVALFVQPFTRLMLG